MSIVRVISIFGFLLLSACASDDFGEKNLADLLGEFPDRLELKGNKLIVSNEEGFVRQIKVRCGILEGEFCSRYQITGVHKAQGYIEAYPSPSAWILDVALIRIEDGSEIRTGGSLKWSTDNSYLLTGGDLIFWNNSRTGEEGGGLATPWRLYKLAEFGLHQIFEETEKFPVHLRNWLSPTCIKAVAKYESGISWDDADGFLALDGDNWALWPMEEFDKYCALTE